MSDSQQAFFAAIWPFLEGRAGVLETTLALGPSRSGDARLQLYPELIRRQKRGIIDHFFAAARAECVAREPHLWDDLAGRFVRAVAPSHWEPNHYARPMLAFLEEQRGSDPRISTAMIELADYAWVRFSAMIAAHQDGSELERSLFVRHYTHDVATFTTDVEHGVAATRTSPEVRPCTLLIVRSRHTSRLEIVTPSLAALLALRRREAPGEPLSLPHGLTWPDVDREERALIALGVLGPAAMAVEMTRHAS